MLATPIVVISEILGVPGDRPRVLEFGELAAPSLASGFRGGGTCVCSRDTRFDCWLEGHLQQLRRSGDDLMNRMIQIMKAEDNETQLDGTELGDRGLV